MVTSRFGTLPARRGTHVNRNALLFVLLAGASVVAGPLGLSPARDLWDPYLFPHFALLYDGTVVSARIAFPGLTRDEYERALTVGKRRGEQGTDGVRLSDAYIVDRHDLGTREAGLYVGDLAFGSEVALNQIAPDSMSSMSSETTRTSWSAAAWYAPARQCALRGLSVYGSDVSGTAYEVSDDSVVDIGWRREAVEEATNSGYVGLVALLQGPWSGNVRVGAEFRGSFDRTSMWAKPAALSLAEDDIGLSDNALRLDIDAGYVRADSARSRMLLVNLVLHTGGSRRFSRDPGTDTWTRLSGLAGGADTLGGSAEVTYSRRVPRGPVDFFWGVTSLYQLKYHYDPQGSYTSWVAKFSNDRRTDRASLALPLCLRVHLGAHVALFAAWRPELAYTRLRADNVRGATGVHENTELLLLQAGLGLTCRLFDRVRVTVVPLLNQDVLLSAIECRLAW
jgi:hypothetical protein